MPGLRASYRAIDADVEFRYADEHEFCMARAYWPAGAVGGVYIVFGTMAAQPTIWDTEYDPDTVIDPDDIEPFLSAGIAFVRADIPIGPQTAVTSRHPFRRLPDNWRMAARVVQFIKTHALDRSICGVDLPVQARKYAVSGTSGGAHIAAMLGFAPDGAMPYDVAAPWNMDAYVERASHRIGAMVLLDFATADFRLFSGGVSAAAVPFFRVAEGLYPDTRGVAGASRLETISDEDKLSASVLPIVDADFQENRNVWIFVNSSAQSMEEASYLGSGATFSYTSLASGSNSGAVRIQVTTSTGKFATIKLIQVGTNGQTYVYAEPDSGTVIADFTGSLDLVNAASAIVGTLTAYSVQGKDTQKAYVTRSAALALIGDDPVTEFTTPHRVDFSALLQRSRYAIRDRHGLGSVWNDLYHIGSAYPAQISGDLAAYPYNNVGTLTASIVAWLEEVMDL